MAPILKQSPESRTPTVSKQASVSADYQPGPLPELKALSVPRLAPLLRTIHRGYARGCTSQLGSLVYQSQQGFLRVHSETRRATPRPTTSKATFPKKTARNLQPATGRTDTRTVSDSTNCRPDTRAVSDSTTTRGYASATSPPPAKNNRGILLRHGRPERPGHRTRPGNRWTLYQV